MPREILFKGKQKNNGEWIEGGYAEHDGKDFIVTWVKYVPDTRDWETVEYYENNPHYESALIEVIPETVCQYTGLADCNKRKVFEGDIVKVQHTDGQEDYTEISEVSWDEKNADFSPWNWQYQCDGCDLCCEIQSIEVIGNIFDNAELLN